MIIFCKLSLAHCMEREKVRTGPTTITESHRESHLVTSDTVKELTHGGSSQRL